MRHSDFTGLRPANDTPRDDHQLEMFGEQIIGADLGKDPSVGVAAEVDRDGRVVGLRVIEGVE